MFKYTRTGNFLVVQWLKFSIFTVMASVQSQIRELRSPKPHVMAKQNKQTNKQTKTRPVHFKPMFSKSQLCNFLSKEFSINRMASTTMRPFTLKNSPGANKSLLKWRASHSGTKAAQGFRLETGNLRSRAKHLVTFWPLQAMWSLAKLLNHFATVAEEWLTCKRT